MPKVLLRSAVGVIVATTCVAAAATAADATLSAKQWRKKANSICAGAEARTRQVQQDAFGELKPDEQPSLAQMTTYVDGVAPIVRDVSRQIAALDEPEKLHPRVQRFVRAMRRDLARLVADPARGLEGNPFTDTTLRAEALRLHACS